jgi:hypothetical protein
MDYGEDRLEQSQKDFQFATKETIENAKLNPDPILVWAETGKLNAFLEESVIQIRAAIKYLSSDTGLQTLNYYSLDCPGGRSNVRTTDETSEPKSVKRYLDWSPVVISRFGGGGFAKVKDCITDGMKCDWDLFHSAIKLF